MNAPVKIECPNCNNKSIAVLGTVGPNVGAGGKLYQQGAAVTECSLCGYMISSEEELSKQLQKLIEETNIKKVGIVVDNFKLNKYKEELTKAGFKFEIGKVTEKLTSIIIPMPEKDFKQTTEQIKNMCKRMELHFKNRN